MKRSLCSSYKIHLKASVDFVRGCKTKVCMKHINSFRRLELCKTAAIRFCWCIFAFESLHWSRKL